MIYRYILFRTNVLLHYCLDVHITDNIFIQIKIQSKKLKQKEVCNLTLFRKILLE